VRASYADFGPTPAAEVLAEQHGLTVSRETLRGWMITPAFGSPASSAGASTSQDSGARPWARRA